MISGPSPYGMTAPAGAGEVTGSSGPGVGEPMSVALSRNSGGIVLASVV